MLKSYARWVGGLKEVEEERWRYAERVRGGGGNEWGVGDEAGGDGTDDACEGEYRVEEGSVQPGGRGVTSPLVIVLFLFREVFVGELDGA